MDCLGNPNVIPIFPISVSRGEPLIHKFSQPMAPMSWHVPGRSKGKDAAARH